MVELSVLVGESTFVFLKHGVVINILKTRLLPDLKPSQNVPKHSLFILCKFHGEINGRYFAGGQNGFYNA